MSNIIKTVNLSKSFFLKKNLNILKKINPLSYTHLKLLTMSSVSVTVSDVSTQLTITNPFSMYLLSNEKSEKHQQRTTQTKTKQNKKRRYNKKRKQNGYFAIIKSFSRY